MHERMDRGGAGEHSGTDLHSMLSDGFAAEFWSERIPRSLCGVSERIRLCSYLENRDSLQRLD